MVLAYQQFVVVALMDMCNEIFQLYVELEKKLGLFQKIKQMLMQGMIIHFICSSLARNKGEVG